MNLIKKKKKIGGFDNEKNIKLGVHNLVEPGIRSLSNNKAMRGKGCFFFYYYYYFAGCALYSVSGMTALNFILC